MLSTIREKKHIMIVEKEGRSIKNALAPNDPWDVKCCEDEGCFPCSSSTGPVKISCRVPGVVYTIICVQCEQEGKKPFYFGESGKNAYERGKKHLDQFRAGSASHCMTIHARVHHPDVPRLDLKFKMTVLKRMIKPLDRQISEALCISNSSVDVLMNSGSEWRGGQVPRAAVARPT